jgi:hypothetical protein
MLKEFKLELDIFNEHHLGNILYSLYNGERSYTICNRILTIEGFEPIKIYPKFLSRTESLRLTNNKFIVDIYTQRESHKIGTGIDIYIIDDSGLWLNLYKRLSINYTTIDQYCIVNNIFYYSDQWNVYMIDLNNNNMKSIINLEYMIGDTFQVLNNKKIVIDHYRGVYIINEDGSYYDVKSFQFKINDTMCINENKLFFYYDKEIICIDTDKIDEDKFISRTSTELNIRSMMINPNYQMYITHEDEVNILNKKTINLSDYLKEYRCLESYSLNNDTSRLLVVGFNYYLDFDLKNFKSRSTDLLPSSAGFIDINNLASKDEIRSIQKTIQIKATLIKTIII